MPEKLTVLFLPHPLDPSMFKPWGEDVVAAIGDRHHLKILDYNQLTAPQFEGVEVVIDQGGSAGTREMADAAAGKVRLWQILGTGIDHFEWITGAPIKLLWRTVRDLSAPWLWRNVR